MVLLHRRKRRWGCPKLSIRTQPLDKPTATCCLNSSHISLNCKISPPIPRVACAIVADTHIEKRRSRHPSNARVMRDHGSVDSRAKRSGVRPRADGRDARGRRRRRPRTRAGASCSWSSSRTRTRRRRARRGDRRRASAAARSCARKSALSHTGPTICQRRAGTSRGRTALDVVPRVVERGTEEVVHRRIDDREVALAAGLEVQDARQQHARIADQEPARLEQELVLGARRAPAARRARRRTGSIGFLVAVADAEPAAQVDVIAARSRRLRARSTSSNIFPAASTQAARSVICEPMWQSMPRTSTSGKAGARAGRVAGASSKATPNLLSFETGRDVRMRLRVDVGIHPQRNRSDACPRAARPRRAPRARRPIRR